METKPVESTQTTKTTYVEPTLAKRDQLIDVIEAPPIVSGVV